MFHEISLNSTVQNSNSLASAAVFMGLTVIHVKTLNTMATFVSNYVNTGNNAYFLHHMDISSTQIALSLFASFKMVKPRS